MEPAASLFGFPQRIEQNRIFVEAPLVDVLVNQREVLVYDAPRAENHVAHL